jgi:hypothetical protein
VALGLRGLRRALTDDEQDTVAKEIVEHLELCNWKMEPGEPLRGHGSNFIPDQNS